MYLKGVRYPDLQAVLNFMYHGEVNVAQEELNSFLAVAEDLKVKGLTQNKPQKENKERGEDIQHTHFPTKKAQTQSYEREPVPQSKKPRPVSTPQSISRRIHPPSQEEIQEVVPVKTEPKEHTISTPAVSDHSVKEGAVDLYEAHPQVHHTGPALAPVDDQGYQENYEEYEYGGQQQGYALATLGHMGVESINTGIILYPIYRYYPISSRLITHTI